MVEAKGLADAASVHADPEAGDGFEFFAAGSQQPHDGARPGVDEPGFDAGDRGLRDVRPRRQLPLAEPGPATREPYCPSDVHSVTIAQTLSK